MPCRLAKLKKALAAYGVELEKPKGGSHWKFRKDRRMYTIPAHKGLKSEVDDKYLRGLCKLFGLDMDEVKRNT